MPCAQNLMACSTSSPLRTSRSTRWSESAADNVNAPALPVNCSPVVDPSPGRMTNGVPIAAICCGWGYDGASKSLAHQSPNKIQPARFDLIIRRRVGLPNKQRPAVGIAAPSFVIVHVVVMRDPRKRGPKSPLELLIQRGDRANVGGESRRRGETCRDCAESAGCRLRHLVSAISAAAQRRVVPSCRCIEQPRNTGQGVRIGCVRNAMDWNALAPADNTPATALLVISTPLVSYSATIRLSVPTVAPFRTWMPVHCARCGT